MVTEGGAEPTASWMDDLRFRAAGAEASGKKKGEAIEDAFIHAAAAKTLPPDLATLPVLASLFGVGTSHMHRVLTRLIERGVLRRKSGGGYAPSGDLTVLLDRESTEFVQRMIALGLSPEEIEQATWNACRRAAQVLKK